MSLAEMKVAVIEKIATAKDEADIREVLKQLDDLAANGARRLNLAQHYDAVAGEYKDALQRLAQ